MPIGNGHRPRPPRLTWVRMAKRLRRAGCKLPSNVRVAQRIQALRRLLLRENQKVPDCWNDAGFGACEGVDPMKCPAVCPMARKLGLINIVPFMVDVIGDHLERVHLVTLVDPRWVKDIGDLADFDVGKARQVLANRFGKLGALEFIAVGGFEATVNIELDGSCHWAPHIHLVVVGPTREDLREALEPAAHARRSGMVLRPLRIDEVDDLIRVLCYALKGEGGRRTAYLTNEGNVRRRDQRLLTDHAAEFAKWQAAHRLDEVLTMHGIRRDGGRLRVLTKKSGDDAN